jgi:hypothetical protein
MRFLAVHRLATTLMVLAAFGALALGGQLDRVVVVLVLLALGASVLLPERHQPGRVAQVLWTVATFVALALCVLEFTLRDELMLATVNFLLFLLVNKLFNRRSSRDDLQLYAVTFMMLVAGSVLNVGLSYAVCFVVYVIATTWALILFHLRREMEENYLIKHSSNQASERVAVDRILGSRRIVGGQFLLGTSAASLTVFALAIGFFLLFPRLGTGSTPAGRRGGSPVTGFTEQIALGGHGVLRDNPTVVMRVFLRGPDAARRAGPLYLRGMAFDTYRSGSWSRSDRAPGPPAQRVGPVHTLELLRPDPRQSGPREALRSALVQEIFLEPIGTNLLFAAAQPVGIDLGGDGDRTVRVGPGGELRTAFPREAVRYLAYSDVRRPDRARLRSLPVGPVPAEIASHYLGVPDQLPRAFHVLARQITAGRRAWVERVEAVLAHLRQGFRYTRTLPRPGDAEPIFHFLTQARAGHCEYFASSMTLLLRAAGVPARVVTGFHGGVVNPYGGYVMIRQGDAHAWVEVWYPGVGWVPYDPTPAAGRSPVVAAGRWERWAQWWDNLRMRWQRWVIQYDVGRQIRLFEGMRHQARAIRGGASRTAAAVPRWAILATLGGVGGLVLLVLALRRWRRRSVGVGAGRLPPPPGPVRRATGRLLRVLRHHGYPRSVAQTVRELALTVDAAHQDLGVTGVVDRLYHLRYSGRPAAVADLAAVRRDIDRIGQNLARVPEEPAP